MALKKVASFWKSDKGKTKLSGKVEREGANLAPGAKLLLFANDKGDNPKRPDYTLHVAVDDEDPGAPPSGYSEPTSDDDLPF